MSSRRHTPAHRHTPARHQEVVLYQKVLSSNGEDDAPDYICVPIEQAQKQAVTPAKGVTRRRAASTPGYGYERETPSPIRRRGPTPSAPPPTPQTPRRATPRSPLPPLEEDAAFSPLRTPRRSSRPVGRPRGSVTPKETPEKLFDDGRGSPEERQRKSKLAKSLPRTPDGKFAPKYDPQSEDYQSDGYQSEEDEGGESFRGSSPKYSSKKKKQQNVSPAKRQTKAIQRRSPVKEPFVEEEVSDDEDEAVATRPSRPLVEIQHGANQSASSNSRSGDNISSGDSFDGITEYHKNINTTFNVTMISDSNIGSLPSSDSDE